MKKGTQRQLSIKRIITTKVINSQEELLAELGSQGFDLTQATLSRDLKTLKVAKVPDGKNGYRYAIPESVSTSQGTSNVDFLVEGFRDIQFSGNLAVIKTKPGYASSIAVFLDNANLYEIMGTIAGDDTILLIMREGVTAVNLTNSLLLLIPKLNDKVTLNRI